jgi:hypothetical protein
MTSPHATDRNTDCERALTSLLLYLSRRVCCPARFGEEKVVHFCPSCPCTGLAGDHSHLPDKVPLTSLALTALLRCEATGGDG